jgi:hypothetical protein
MTPATRSRALATAMVAAALLAVGACGGSSGDDGVAAADAAAPDRGSQDADAQALAFAQCMRDNGVDMPDPGPGQQGFYEAFHELEANYDQATLQEALTACEDLMPTFAAEQHGDDEDMLALVECLRDQGLDVPDNLFENGMPPNVHQDELMAAMEECRGVLAGGGG